MILNSLNIASNGFTSITLSESLKPPLFLVWTHAPALHQAQTLCSVYTPHLSSLPFCKHAADIWKNYGIHPCYGFLLIIAFCPPRLQELLTAWASDYLHSFTAPLHHTMACNVHWGLIFVFILFFPSIFGLLISCRHCLLPCFFLLSCSLPPEISVGARRWSAMSLSLWCDTLAARWVNALSLNLLIVL